MKRQTLIDYFGGRAIDAARKLGYSHKRADNNITRLPDVLTTRQRDAIFMRMKSKRIPIPKEWL